VVSYLGYARQDRRHAQGVPISAKLIATILEAAGIDQLVTMDLHSKQVEGFFQCAVENLSAQSTLAKAVKDELTGSCVVVAPDVGSSKLARAYARQLNADLALVCWCFFLIHSSLLSLLLERKASA